MKNLIFLLLLILSLPLFAQNNHQQSNANTIEDFQGLVRARKGFINGRYADTTAANLDYPKNQAGIQIIVGDTLWIRNSAATKWIAVGLAATGNLADTVYTKAPIAVYIDSTGHQVIYFLQNGLIAGGVITRAACLQIGVTPATYGINFRTYTSNAFILTVSPSDPSHPRTDAVVADTLGNVYIITGTPSNPSQLPAIDPSYQILLGSYTIGANASCIGILSETVYDQNLGTPTEWGTSTSGTLTNDFANTINPYHLTIADHVTTYATGSQLIFIKGSNDTSQLNEVLNFFVYLNKALGNNQFQVSVFNGSTQVGNTVSFNVGYGLNPNDSTNYQNISIPFSALNINPNTVFTKIVIQFAGNDLSGAGGLYIDYIQLQTGAGIVPYNSDWRTFISSDSLYQNINGIKTFIGTFGGGSGSGDSTLQQIFNTEHGNAQLNKSDTITTNKHGFQIGTTFGIDINGLLILDSAQGSGSEALLSAAYNSSGDKSYFQASSDASGKSFDIASNNVTGGFHSSEIFGTADNSTSTITYNADTHTINGQIFTPSLSNGNLTDSIVSINTATGKLAYRSISVGSGSTNSNIGSGFRLAVPNTNNIKTLFNGLWINHDSTSNTNGITAIADSAGMATYFLRRKDSVGNSGFATQYDLTTKQNTISVTTPITLTGASVGIVNQGSTTTVLHGNASGNASFSAVNLTSDVSNVLPIANGGTNNGSLSVTNGNLLYTDGSKVVSLGIGTTRQKLGVIGGIPAWVDSTAVTSSATGANPTASVTLSAINGSASTFMRSDASPPISQTIAPTWTGLHTFSDTSGLLVTASGEQTYELTNRQIGLGIPVTMIRPLASAQAMAVDIEPSAGAAKFSGLYAWIDILDTTQKTVNTRYNTLRLGMGDSALIGTIHLGASSRKRAMIITNNGTPVMWVDSLGNVEVGSRSTGVNDSLFSVLGSSKFTGKMRIVDGTQGAGFVLQSSADGTASWANVALPDTAFLRLNASGGLASEPLPTKGLVLSNNSAATSTTVFANSPALWFNSAYWQSGGSVSRRGFWRNYVTQVSGIKPQLNWDWTSGDSTGAYVTKMSLDSASSLTVTTVNATTVNVSSSIAGNHQWNNSNAIIKTTGIANFGSNTPSGYEALGAVSSTGGLSAPRMTRTLVEKITSVPLSGTLVGGSGYSNGSGTFNFTGGSGTGATFAGTIAGGICTSVVPTSAVGGGYRVGDVLSCNTSSFSGGSGFTYTITRLQGDSLRGVMMVDSTTNDAAHYGKVIYGDKFGSHVLIDSAQFTNVRVSAQFDKTNTTLADITGLSANVYAAGTYKFEATLYTTSNVGGGVKFAIGGTATATNIIYEAVVIDNDINAAQTRATSLATAVGGVTAVTNALCKISGTITVNATGTLTTQFAENVATATSSVLVGSTFSVTQIQ